MICDQLIQFLGHARQAVKSVSMKYTSNVGIPLILVLSVDKGQEIKNQGTPLSGKLIEHVFQVCGPFTFGVVHLLSCAFHFYFSLSSVVTLNIMQGKANLY